ncbi:MAG: hypothetical protein GX163_12430 [Bacteroidetes bacterium]|nr:hypothetical protein [Bacteroidota bacterium]
MERSDKFKKKENKTEKEKREAKIDFELEQTFPASDPPSYSKPGNYKEDKDKAEK